MVKIWICGSQGQLGQAINQVGDPLSFEFFNTDLDIQDITNLATIMNFGTMNTPDVIVNCSGMTDFHECEGNPQDAFNVNAVGARNLAIVARKIGARLVQISTDDVFDGTSLSPYSEFDTPHPMTVYGKSKLAGENFVREFNDRHFIIRSTWVYGAGTNFVTSFLSQIQRESTLSIASDQFGSPTSAIELAKFILNIIQTSEYGTYHATCSGSCSRYAFAKEIMRLSGKRVRIKAVPTLQSEFSSVHPAFAVLDNTMLNLTGLYQFPGWKQALSDYIQEIGVNRNELV